MIPEFESNGQLPAGIYPASWGEFRSRFAASHYRSEMMDGLLKAAKSLQRAGCRKLYVDGSFVTSKEIPGDFDACWSIEGVNPDMLDPVLLTFENGRAAQKARFMGELFPAESFELGTGKTWLEFFQNGKETGEKKGVIEIDLGTLP